MAIARGMSLTPILDRQEPAPSPKPANRKLTFAAGIALAIVARAKT
jgi:hypothetical protein